MCLIFEFDVYVYVWVLWNWHCLQYFRLILVSAVLEFWLTSFRFMFRLTEINIKANQMEQKLYIFISCKT